LYLEIENELLGDLDSTDELIVEVEKLLASEAAISSYTSAIGGPLPKFYMITPFNYPSSDFGQVLIYLDLSESKGFDDKVDYAYYLQDQLDQTIIGGKVKVNILEMSEPKPEIEIRIQGDDLDRLIEVGTEIKDALKEMDALVNVEETIPNLRYEYLVDVDKELSSAMGISQYDIERQINLAVNGANATVMRKEGKELAVYLKSDIASKDELENLMIKSSFVNNKYLVKQLADIELVSKRDIVSRFQKEAIIQINANVRPEYTTSEVQSEISAFIMDEIDKSGVDVSFGGEKEFFAEYMGSLGLAGIIAIALIYLILLIQFNSFIQPLVILITAPLSVVGSILGLFIFRMPITFTSLLGVISLFGIVVNNGILLIEYINKARSEGSDIESACKDSVSKRFNPIILSTATTIMGLVPLALSGSSFFAPMAVALMSGLVVATVLTMVIIPTVYRMIVR